MTRRAMLGVSVALSFIGPAAFARESSRATSFAIPVRLPLPGEPFDESDDASLLREPFCPIGWSRDGKLACLFEPADEACACYFADLRVQGMHDDRLAWAVRYDSDGKKEDTRAAYWGRNQSAFSRRLSSLGIEPMPRFTLQPSRFADRGDAFGVEIVTRPRRDAGAEAGVAWQLRATSARRGVKAIAPPQHDRDRDRGTLPIDARIAGVLVSPFEPLAAVVVRETHRGWEGPPHVTHIRLVGLSLASGFHS